MPASSTTRRHFPRPGSPDGPRPDRSGRGRGRKAACAA
jgi:hypothetical protein